MDTDTGKAFTRISRINTNSIRTGKVPVPLREWGAYASRVWMAASRGKFGATILQKPIEYKYGESEADGETPSAAREARALPKLLRRCA